MPTRDTLRQQYTEWGFIKPLFHVSLFNPLGFEQAHDLALQMPEFIRQKTFRKLATQLKPIDITNIPPTHLPWLKLVMAMLAQGFVWCQGEEEKTNFVPGSIAVPLVQVSALLNEPPILNYADYVLRNTPLTKPEIQDQPPFKTLYTFTGLESEYGFILTHVLYELKGREALRLGISLNKTMDNNRIEPIKTILEKLDGIIFELIEAFNTVYVTTTEQDFREHFRIFLKGWKNIIPQMTYHETTIQAKELRGETGAQSSLLPFLDSIVGVGQKLIDFNHLYAAWRPYMPEVDRLFLSNTEILGQKLRHIVSVHHDLIPFYNAILDRLIAFRKNHLVTITQYIEGKNQDLSHSLGTGGSFYPEYLGSLINHLESLKF